MKPINLLGLVAIMLLNVAVYAQETGKTIVQVNVHENVQEALDWQLPENPCKRPKPPGDSKEIRDEQGVTRTQWDVDGYTLARYERKEKRWKKCVDKYKQSLAAEQETLKSSAQYGLTQQQANIILGKMKTIQSVLLSPDGTLPVSTE